MKMNEGCKGCCHYFFYIRECRYAPRGMKVIPDCICQECLIKPVCKSLCYDFHDGWGGTGPFHDGWGGTGPWWMKHKEEKNGSNK